MADKVLIVMDDLELAVQLNAALEETGYDTTMVSSFDDAGGILRRTRPDLAVLTGSLHEPTALQVLTGAHQQRVPAIGMVEEGEPDAAGLAHQLGLKRVFRKPVDLPEVVGAVRRVVDLARLQERTGIHGNSPAVQEVLVKIEQMAPVTSTVLIEGESGTGKELVARAIHDLSGRRDKPFIAVNSAALPDALLESELFGHEKGSFTGAAERRLGRFELADGGTLFLDEVGEIPPATQVKLLRVLEERSFFRVGGTEPIRVDVRVIAATNSTLKDLVAVGKFRDDLFYRLNVLSIYLPPLRDRRSDIPILVGDFIRDFSKQHDRTFRGFTPGALQVLVDAPWPGNVRQLRNLIESMVVLAPGEEIREGDIPDDVRTGGPRQLPVHVGGPGPQVQGQELAFILHSLVDLKLQVEDLRRRMDEPVAPEPGEVIEVSSKPAMIDVMPVVSVSVREPEPEAVIYEHGMTMADVERATIEVALKETRGNRRKAAEVLGIGERTLYRKIKEYQLG